MRKVVLVPRLVLVFALFAGGVASLDAQRIYSRDYARSRGYSRGYQNSSRIYPNYSRGYNSFSYRTPIIQPRIYSPFAFGPRYYGVPHGSISITFGGNPYFYFGGSFYRPYGGYYRSVLPPIGIRIGILPPGCIPIYVGPDPYYFYNGIFYRRYDDRSYEVVDAPMGAQLSSLPKGARLVTVNGEKFYELDGTYFKEDRDSRGRVVYTVVGKNGQIDNTDDAPAPSATPRVGDRVSELPPNSKLITLHGAKLYVSPNDTYYQAETDGTFTIVGIANETT